jgi:hypothetical protein
MLAVLLGLAAPARAGTITFGDVARTIGASGQLRPASEVRLRFGAQGGAVTAQGVSSPNAATSSSEQQTTGSQPMQTASASTDPTISQSGGHVETVDLGDVTGTVCDCGEIPSSPIPKGGFPWWALAGIPLVCVSGICTKDNTPPETPPGPTPPNIPTPEPMTLLLFGSGLLALGSRARRRHGRREDEVEMANTVEEV